MIDIIFFIENRIGLAIKFRISCTACPILLATYFCLALAVEWKYVPALICTILRPMDITLFVESTV